MTSKLSHLGEGGFEAGREELMGIYRQEIERWGQSLSPRAAGRRPREQAKTFPGPRNQAGPSPFGILYTLTSA